MSVTEWEQADGRALALELVAARCRCDSDFRRRLEEAPHATLAAEDILIPPNVAISVHTNSATVLHTVIGGTVDRDTWAAALASLGPPSADQEVRVHRDSPDHVHLVLPVLTEQVVLDQPLAPVLDDGAWAWTVSVVAAEVGVAAMMVEAVVEATSAVTTAEAVAVGVVVAT